MTISDNLKSIQEKLGISQADIARRSGIPQPTVLRIFSGEIKDPGASRLSALKKALNSSYEQIIEGKGLEQINEKAHEYHVIPKRKKNERAERLCDFITEWMKDNTLDDQTWFEGDFKRHHPEYEKWLRSKDSKPQEKMDGL